MDIKELVSQKSNEVLGIEAKLKGLSEVTGVPENIPPLWNGDLKQLGGFVTELEEWVKSPKVKRAKQIIEVLKKGCLDKRGFQNIPEGYLVSSLTDLETALTLFNGRWDNRLKSKFAKNILDELLMQGSIDTIAEELSKYNSAVQELIDEKVVGDFLELVKKSAVDLILESKEPDFTEIEVARKNLEKARNAIELLDGSGISMSAYTKSFSSSKSVDIVWQQANSIRELLNKTALRFTAPLVEPFAKAVEIDQERVQSLQKETLSDVQKDLEENYRLQKEWRKQLHEAFIQEFDRVSILLNIANLNVNLDETKIQFAEKINDSQDVQELFTLYSRLLEAKQDAMKVLESRISDPNQRRIIESIDDADELAEEMGEQFWDALKELRKSGLVRIHLSGGME
ncbi:MAG: hypothetical protein M1387_06525 [Thaumarchaeota archaeon]|nr:hypothetical protein [Nitrososphaerota archaeon]